jgi:hypothetical protein
LRAANRDVLLGDGVGSVFRPIRFRWRYSQGGSYLKYQTAFARDVPSRRAESQTGRPMFSRPFPLWAIVFTLLLLPGCNSINPLCGSARPVPVIGSLSDTTVTLTQVQQGFVLTVSGKEFVSASVVMINGTSMSTTVVSSVELQATVPAGFLPAPGSANVTVKTPSGNSGNLGCSSGGTSAALTMTIN